MLMAELLFPITVTKILTGTVDVDDIISGRVILVLNCCFLPLHLCRKIGREARLHSVRSQLRVLALFGLFFAATVCLWIRPTEPAAVCSRPTPAVTYMFNVTRHIGNSDPVSVKDVPNVTSCWLEQMKQSCIDYNAETLKQEEFLWEVTRGCYAEIQKDPLSSESQLCKIAFSRYLPRTGIVSLQPNRVVSWCANTFTDIDFSAYYITHLDPLP